MTESALEQVFETLDLDQKVRLTDNIGDADVILALRAKLKHNSWVRDVAKLRQLPIYAIKVGGRLWAAPWGWDSSTCSLVKKCPVLRSWAVCSLFLRTI